MEIDFSYWLDLPNNPKLRPGNHIRYRIFGAEAWHHAIYIGRGRVIEYGREGVVEADVPTHCYVQRVNSYRKGSRSQVVARAKHMLKLRVDNYHLFYRNCEHFANSCRHEKWHSEQIERLKRIPIVGDLI